MYGVECLMIAEVNKVRLLDSCKKPYDGMVH